MLKKVVLGRPKVLWRLEVEEKIEGRLRKGYFALGFGLKISAMSIKLQGRLGK